MSSSSEFGRIGVVGAGGVGGFYGIMLARAGLDVHFLLRGDYAAVAANGLTLHSKQLGDTVLHPVAAYRDVAQMPPCDWLLVATKATDNAALAQTLARAAAPGARVVLLQNGLGAEDSLRHALPDSVNLLGCLCIVSAHRVAPGVIEHHDYHSVTLGYHSGPGPAPGVLAQGAALFEAGGITASLADDLLRARWQKLVMNVPFNGLSVLLGSGTRDLMAHPRTRALIRELMEEVCAGAAACGHALPDGYIDQAWRATDGKPDYTPSMLLDFTARRPLELEAIYAAPLAAAAAAGQPMRKVEMLYQTLCFLDARNRGMAR